MRTAFVVSVVLFTAANPSLAANAAAADGQSVKLYELNIPRQSLDQALKDFAQQTGLQVARLSDVVAGAALVGPVEGSLSVEQALRSMLEGQGLTYKLVDNTTIAVMRVEASSSFNSPSTTAGDEESLVSENKRALEEIVVTAQKREERLQDTPVPVAVISASTLAQNSQPRLRDFYGSVPGFSMSPTSGGGNQQVIAIRGISSGPFGNPTVGVTVDDAPYGGFIREFAPDFDPSDLARVEVLRGPQGTLYGASSMGGLLKFVTIDPSVDGVSGHVQADANVVEDGSDAGYAFRGALNLPLKDTLALRASAFARQDPGYVDNPVLGAKDVNEVSVSGGRLAAKWQPSDAFSMKLSAIYQEMQSDGLSDVTRAPGVGELEQNYIRGVGPSRQELQAYSAILTGDVGNAEVVAVSGYNVYKTSALTDFTYAFGTQAQRLFGVPGAAILSEVETSKFSQEIRASLPIGERLEWLVGGFYTYEDIPFGQDFYAMDATTGRPVGMLQYLRIPITHSETAVFTNLTLQVTERFDLQLGGRESFLKEDFKAVDQGGALIGAPIVIPAITSDQDVFTYQVTPRFKVSPVLMVYARIASGFRPSRANSFNTDPLVPRSAKPDETQNYEIGVKGSAFDNVLTLDASIYYIDWKDIQISLNNPRNRLNYFTNGSRAKSEGVELSLGLRPANGLTLTAWGSYNAAELTEGFPAASPLLGPAGSRLPYSSRFSGHVSVDQEFFLSSSITGHAGVTLTHVGDRRGAFSAAPQEIFPSYNKVDLRAGIEFESWRVNLYANNVGDKRGLLGGGAQNLPPYAYTYIQPRTIGMSVTKTF